MPEPTRSAARTTTSELVEKLGFGWAQAYLQLCSGAGIFFVDGAELVLLTIITMSTTAEFGLSPNQAALLTTFSFLGVAIGAYIAGYFGDTFGRRFSVLLAFLLISVTGCVASAMPSYSLLLVARTFLGIAIGFSQPPTVAMVSENTPERHRVLMRLVTTAFFPLGGIVVAALSTFDDPSLKQLDWRGLMIIVAIFPAVWGLMASFVLPESPVFLASVGKHSRAQLGFEWMKWANSAEEVDVDYDVSQAEPVGGEQNEKTLTFWEQVGVAFSLEFRLNTALLAVFAFCVNVCLFGFMYACPLVLGSEEDEQTAGRNILIQQVILLVVTILVYPLAIGLPRMKGIALAIIATGAAHFAFAYAIPMPEPLPIFPALMKFFGVGFAPAGSSLGFILVYQNAVETLPSNASATAGAIVIGSGRLGSMIAPLLFENLNLLTGSMAVYFYLVGFFCLAAACAAAFTPTMVPFSVAEALGSKDVTVYGTL